VANSVSIFVGRGALRAPGTASALFGLSAVLLAARLGGNSVLAAQGSAAALQVVAHTHAETWDPGLRHSSSSAAAPP
jgi:hypothetical protein